MYVIYFSAHDYSDNNNTLTNAEYVTVAPARNHHQHHAPLPKTMETSPHNNSSSEKESTSSSTNLGSTFRANHGKFYLLLI